ncbi:MAG: hypothetical protein IKS05_09830 [Oscillospiraceae bacterium]|nr:hypothetical protein [Oscillospiraceae bacterium]
MQHYSWYCKDKLYGFTWPTVIYDPATETIVDVLYDNKLVETDAADGTTRTLLGQNVAGLYAHEAVLYYFEADKSRLNAAQGTNYERGTPGFREMDLESGVVKDCGLPDTEIFWAQYDEDYIYAQSYYDGDNPIHTFFVLTRNYELAGRIELTDGLGIAAVTSDRVYFCNALAGAPISGYLDKSKIGTGELELIPIKMVG